MKKPTTEDGIILNFRTIFLGLNPLSRFVFPKIKQSSLFFRWFENTYYKSKFKLLKNFAIWFLNEYY